MVYKTELKCRAETGTNILTGSRKRNIWNLKAKKQVASPIS